MSRSLQGVVVDRDAILELRPDNGLVAAAVARLSKMLDRFYKYELDRDDFVDAFKVSLAYLCDRGNHPGRTPEGSFLTHTLLDLVGTPVHSNGFNPIGWVGLESMHDELIAAGSPVELVNVERGAGPWGLSDPDCLFLGGWDQADLRALSNSIHSCRDTEISFALSEFNRWIDLALDSGQTIWAWHS